MRGLIDTVLMVGAAIVVAGTLGYIAARGVWHLVVQYAAG
jgi:hypothetical protein